MDAHELVLDRLHNILIELFSSDVVENVDYTKPIKKALCNANAVDYSYFLLEISRAFQIELSHEIIENYMNWSLEGFAHVVQECIRSKNSNMLDAVEEKTIDYS